MPKGEHLKGKGGVKFGQGQDNTQGGRKHKPKFVDLLEEIAENEGKMQFDKFRIINNNGVEVVEIQLPSEMAMAIKVWNMSSKDVRWFAEMAKIRSLYATNKTDITILKGADDLFIED